LTVAPIRRTLLAMTRISAIVIRSLLALLLAVMATGAPAADTAPARPDSSAFLAVVRDGGGYGLTAGEDDLREQVLEPLFAFVFSLTEADSLGTWTLDDLQGFAQAWGRPSDFPLPGHFVSMTREALPEGEVSIRRGVRCRRRWTVTLHPDLVEFPLPFSILGYHPGTLSFRQPLVLNEWRLDERTIHVTVEGATRRYVADGLTIWEVAAGWIILDVDGWLDKLLGKAADDAVLRGFTACRVEGEMVGVGMSLGRDGRRIFGEFDFRSGEIENHGRPLARGLSRYSRGWTDPDEVDHEALWRVYEDR
jgi:hypothetical protein